MFSLVVFSLLVATALAKPTDSVVSVSQDSLGNYDINYKIEDIKKPIAVIEPHLRSEHILRSAELASPTLIAQPRVELPSYKVVEVPTVQAVPQISTLRSSQFTSIQQEVPVVAERKIELPTYKLLDIPEVRTVAQPKIEVPSFRVVQVPEIEREIVAERRIEPTYKLVSEIPSVRSSHFATVQNEVPLVSERRLEVPSYKVVEVPSVRSELVPVHEQSSLLSIPSHSFLRTVPETRFEKHFVH